MSKRTFDYTGYYTIVLTKAQLNNDNILKKILDDCWSKYIVNVIVLCSLTTGKDSKVLIYTYFPFTSNYCEQVQPIIIDEYQSDMISIPSKRLFPNKLENMHNCPLFLATYNAKPHIFVHKENLTDGNVRIRVTGIDAIIMANIAASMNFTTIIYDATYIGGRGTIFENGTMTGIEEMVNYN